MELTQKMARWQELILEAETLEKEIAEEVDKLGKNQEYGRVVVKISGGKGSYDWEQMAMREEPDEDQIKEHTKSVIDWKALCESCGVSDNTKKLFYTAGKKSISVKLIEDKS
jgi:hypothetical protein